MLNIALVSASLMTQPARILVVFGTRPEAIKLFPVIHALRADPRLATMAVPVLGLIADADRLVNAKLAVATLEKLPDARIVRFGRESAHEILREADPVRDRALAEIDRFLAERAPAA